MTAGPHEVEVARLRGAYAALPPGAPVRLAKRTSNLFRFRDDGPRTSPRKTAQADRGLDVSAFGHVLCVDPDTRTAQVGGMTTYEDLCDATLRHQLMPLVVPQLKTITLGGAVTGLGIESTSLRSGMPHESVTEMEILTGDGRVIRATDDNEHADPSLASRQINQSEPTLHRFESHPIRGQGAGFAAAFAKIGAVMTAFLFPVLLDTIGTQLLLYCLVVTSLLGAAVTWMFRIETTGINLDTLGH